MMMTMALSAFMHSVQSAAMTEDTFDRVETATVGDEDKGTRLDRFLAGRYGDLSRMRVKALIESGHVHVDGATISEADHRVKPGQIVALFVPEPEAAIPIAQDIALTIVYEDADVIVVDKPAGLVVHPAPGNPDRTLVNALIAHCGDQLSGIGGVRRPGIVHRLDKDTSGLLVAAKTDAAHQSLSAQFAAHSVERSYIAVVWGVPAPRRGRIEGRIGRDPHNRKKMAVVARGGKAAVTNFRTLKAYGDIAALVECRLETGRTHQIRVHLASIGHAVVGDPFYGGARRSLIGRMAEPARTVFANFKRQALHARILGFRHPTRPETLKFESKYPNDIMKLTHCLENMQ
ncbi:MAG: RluA family pseudouridine synthase [Alphaproteobacteria bacterium]|nr:RluA family pseudouridine synthase [Alphaproteobacteria bacterium]